MAGPVSNKSSTCLSVVLENLLQKGLRRVLRLAIATPRFWPHVGDEPTHLLRLIEAIGAAGHELTVVTPLWKRTWPRQMNIGGTTLFRLRGSPRGGWSTLRWMYGLSGWLREQHFDVLLVSGLRYEAYVALGSLSAEHKPVILLAGEGDVGWQRSAALGRGVAARCREAAAIVAPSSVVADELVAAGYGREAITIIPRRVSVPPGHSPKARDDARAALAAANYDLVTTESTKIALAVGRLGPEHRFGDLVKAWRIVTAHKPEARLWIVGDGPERETLYRQIGDLDQRFRVLIPGTFDCLDELLQTAEILLVPASHSAPPLALLDAMAAGIPIVAADVPALREQVGSQRTGLLFSSGDFKAIAQAVLSLLDDPAAAVALGAAGRAHVQASPTPAEEAAAYIDLCERM
jgi:glycosyltransferase involved in cell wall biosynthesis